MGFPLKRRKGGGKKKSTKRGGRKRGEKRKKKQQDAERREEDELVPKEPVLSPLIPIVPVPETGVMHNQTRMQIQRIRTLTMASENLITLIPVVST